MKTKEITYHFLKGEGSDLKKAMQVFTEAFQGENITVTLFNFNKKKTEKQFYQATLLNARIHLEMGNDIIVAKHDHSIVGAAVIKKDTPPYSLLQLARRVFPDVLKHLPLLTKIRYGTLFSIHQGTQLSQSLDGKYATLSSLAVSSAYQGMGIGTQFLNKIHRHYAKEYPFIYLYTANRKTKDLYASVGYEVIELRQTKNLDIYHMLYRY